ncbi:MAG: alpha/beta hydrolase [Clostridia bacterium]|nr:alpha/beta hydrolase [Clostridia bacterium]
MKGRKTVKKRYVVLVVLVILAVVLLVNHNLVRMIFYSNWDPELPLNVSEWAGGTEYLNVRYCDVSDSDYLNLYVPDVEHPPLLVIVHGGGFVTNDCESRQAQLMYQYFRDHGFACATVNYRLAQEAKFPAAIEDVKCAVRYLRANAERYGYNADRIAIFGESAGGYLAMMAGVTSDEEFTTLPFIGENVDEHVSAKVSIILNYYGAMKMETAAERKAEFKAIGVPGLIVDGAALWLTDVMKKLSFDGSIEEFFIGRSFSDLGESERELYEPAAYIRKNLTPASDLYVVNWHGDADLTVPLTQSENIHVLLTEKMGENRSQFRIFHNAKHAGEKMYSNDSLSELEKIVREHL